ncbi:MAG: hypothetical protein ACUVSV_02905 [Armatimonadota bacterium]
MKKEVAPSVIIAVIVVVLAVIAYFYYSKTATPPPKEASVFGADGPTGGARDGAGGPGMTPDVLPPAAPQAPR